MNTTATTATGFTGIPGRAVSTPSLGDDVELRITEDGTVSISGELPDCGFVDCSGIAAMNNVVLGSLVDLPVLLNDVVEV